MPKKTPSLRLVTIVSIALTLVLVGAAVTLARVRRVGATAHAIHYTITTLGSLPGYPSSAAAAINTGGWVAGTVGGLSVGEAVVWQNGTMRDLGPGEAFGINDHDQVVGTSPSQAFAPQAVVWQNGKMQVLGIGEAYAINNEGQVVGLVPDPGSDQPKAVLWVHGKMGVLGPGQATGIDDRGVVTGFSFTSNGLRQAWVWQNGERQDLGTLPGTNLSVADSVNDSGQVGGFVGDGFSTIEAVLWTPSL